MKAIRSALRHALRCAAVGSGLVLFSVVSHAQGAQAREIALDIKPQSMSDALSDWARQTGLQVIYPAVDITNRLAAPPVRGTYTAMAALNQLLAGTELTYEFVNERTVSIRERHPSAPMMGEPIGREKGPLPFQRLAAEVDLMSGSESELAQDSDRSEGSEASRTLGAGASKPRDSIDVVVVTGTHIRGETPVGSNLITIDREQIDRSAHTTVQSIVQALPQNFLGGGANEGTGTGAGPAGVNTSVASSINLRGLGPGSTLVLLNGRRLAPAGTDASFVDVSSLPASAIERIEVLLDGASAIYGADAVGGVVNVILKKNYDGAETRLQGSVPIQGAAREYSIGQTLGGSWGTGNAVVTYDYYERDALPMRKRDATASQDLRALGGSDFRETRGNPGTIVVGGRTWAIPRGQDGLSLTSDSLTEGTRNLFDANETKDILPDQRRHSIFGNISQSIGSHFELAADMFVSQRDALAVASGVTSRISVPRANAYHVNPTGGNGPISIDYNFVRDIGPLKTKLDVSTYYGGLSAKVNLPSEWDLSVHADYASESVDQLQLNRPITAELITALADPDPATAFNPFGDGSFTNPTTIERVRGTTTFESDSSMATATLAASGPVARLPAGSLSLATGIELREQQFDTSAQSSSGANIFRVDESSRDVHSAYLELRAPLFAESNAYAGLRRLDLSLAVRYDRYSDFGSAASPAVALAWAPLQDITFRASRTESYKAPTLPSLNESGNSTVTANIPDPLSPTGSSRVLFWTGNANADLNAEQSEAWTVGVDWIPVKWPGSKISLTYFDIDFSDRIQSVNQLAFTFLQEPRFASSVIRNPTRDERVEVCGRAMFSGAQSSDCTDSPVSALIDVRPRNTVTTRQQGIDLLGSYAFDLPVGAVQVAVNAAYLLGLKEALTRTDPAIDLLNTPFQPVDLRLRAAINWSYASWGIGAIVDYVDSYRDSLSNPNRKVASWTGVDLQLRYRVGHDVNTWLEGLSVALHVANAFDSDPPFFNNSAGIGYDPTNSEMSAVLGRTISIRAHKDWGRR